jgi:phosphoglycerate dehydrogenase-like enzyme
MVEIAMEPLVIAHQLGGVLEERLKEGLPPGIIWRRLPPERAWDVPADATLLLAVPQRAGTIVTPEVAPAGWPRNLRWVQALSAGVDEYPRWMFDAPIVTCARGTNSAPIAEFILAALLAFEKKLPEIWIRDARDWKLRDLGTLRGKTLGLLGYGSIGQAVAARALPFGLKVLAHRRASLENAPQGVVEFADLDRVLAESDHLVIALPLTDATIGLINRAALARVKPGVHLVNIARGKIIDQEALIEALNDHRVGFATLDVTEPEPLPSGHPLYTHPRVHLSPHLSWSGGEMGKAEIAFVAANIRRFIAGEPLEGGVNPAFGY